MSPFPCPPSLALTGVDGLHCSLCFYAFVSLTLPSPFPSPPFSQGVAPTKCVHHFSSFLTLAHIFCSLFCFFFPPSPLFFSRSFFSLSFFEGPVYVWTFTAPSLSIFRLSGKTKRAEISRKQPGHVDKSHLSVLKQTSEGGMEPIPLAQLAWSRRESYTWYSLSFFFSHCRLHLRNTHANPKDRFCIFLPTHTFFSDFSLSRYCVQTIIVSQLRFCFPAFLCSAFFSFLTSPPLPSPCCFTSAPYAEHQPALSLRGKKKHSRQATSSFRLRIGERERERRSYFFSHF